MSYDSTTRYWVNEKIELYKKDKNVNLDDVFEHEEIEFLINELELANQTIDSERYVFNLIEKAIEEREDAQEIWKRYAELRDQNPGK